MCKMLNNRSSFDNRVASKQQSNKPGAEFLHGKAIYTHINIDT